MQGECEQCELFDQKAFQFIVETVSFFVTYNGRKRSLYFRDGTQKWRDSTSGDPIVKFLSPWDQQYCESETRRGSWSGRELGKNINIAAGVKDARRRKGRAKRESRETFTFDDRLALWFRSSISYADRNSSPMHPSVLAKGSRDSHMHMHADIIDIDAVSLSLLSSSTHRTCTAVSLLA